MLYNLQIKHVQSLKVSFIIVSAIVASAIVASANAVSTNVASVKIFPRISVRKCRIRKFQSDYDLSENINPKMSPRHYRGSLSGVTKRGHRARAPCRPENP